MTEEHRRIVRRATDTLFHLTMLLTPFLIGIVLYFIKPVFDAVPVIVRTQEVMAVQQQGIANNLAVVSAKQERLDAQIVGVSTKLEVVSEKVTRLERKVDE